MVNPRFSHIHPHTATSPLANWVPESLGTFSDSSCCFLKQSMCSWTAYCSIGKSCINQVFYFCWIHISNKIPFYGRYFRKIRTCGALCPSFVWKGPQMIYWLHFLIIIIAMPRYHVNWPTPLAKTAVNIFHTLGRAPS